jgi:capsular polysaccharide biosynthesis protein
MQATDFNLTDIIAVLQKRWKSIAVFVTVSMVIAAAILFFIPKQYQSTVIIVPGNPLLADKSRLFDQNIQILYGVLGNSDDVETISGIISLDTTYYQLIDTFKLVDYYAIRAETFAAKRKAALKRLKKDLEVVKQEDRQLKISILTKDAGLSAAIVNKAVAIAEQQLHNIWKENYQQNITNLKIAARKLAIQYRVLSDSAMHLNSNADKEIAEQTKKQLLDHLAENGKVEQELDLAVNGLPPVLYILEKGFPSVSADRPQYISSLFIVFLTSFVFGVFLILWNERT